MPHIIKDYFEITTAHTDQETRMRVAREIANLMLEEGADGFSARIQH
jgi:hypothetical protein